uniref:Uncharacterized protein n=1 Tax=Mus musculus TaxID=10090 RepID=Q3UU03_MOUSE|nr:unnamed protein product [Mus musculus]BAE43311.1 unnamed protein product [Mus musculus]
MQPRMTLDSWSFCLHILRAGTADLGQPAWCDVVPWTEPRTLYVLGTHSARGPTIPRSQTWSLMSMGAPGSHPSSLPSHCPHSLVSCLCLTLGTLRVTGSLLQTLHAWFRSKRGRGDADLPTLLQSWCLPALHVKGCALF